MGNNDYELIRPITINPGAQVAGDDFFGRKKEIINLKELLESTKTSVIIPGPRRWGKSSFVNEALRRNADIFTAVYLDLHGVSTIKHFYDRLLLKVQKEVGGVSRLAVKEQIKKMINLAAGLVRKIKINEEIEFEPGEIKDNDSQTLLFSLNKIFNHFPEDKIILVLDEISDYISGLEKKSGKDEAILFLSWLRTLRQDIGVQMILTGSISIEAVVKNLSAEDLINDMKILRLTPLGRDESTLLFLSLLKSKKIKIQAQALEFCKAKIENSPHYFIQVFADEIACTCDRGQVLTQEIDVDVLYGNFSNNLLPAFEDFRTRLKEQLTPQEEIIAKKVLAVLSDKALAFEDLFALTSGLTGSKEKLHSLLRRLCDEGYLMEKDRKFSFISPILADYWNSHFYYEV